jgi:hypothetical protein
MLSEISISIYICLVAFVWLVLLLRSDRISLGLPVAYLSLLFLGHVPPDHLEDIELGLGIRCLRLHMSDHRLDGGAPRELAFDAAEDP